MNFYDHSEKNLIIHSNKQVSFISLLKHQIVYRRAYDLAGLKGLKPLVLSSAFYLITIRHLVITKHDE